MDTERLRRALDDMITYNLKYYRTADGGSSFYGVSYKGPLPVKSYVSRIKDQAEGDLIALVESVENWKVMNGL
jgi:hypothetical protein